MQHNTLKNLALEDSDFPSEEFDNEEEQMSENSEIDDFTIAKQTKSNIIFKSSVYTNDGPDFDMPIEQRKKHMSTYEKEKGNSSQVIDQENSLGKNADIKAQQISDQVSMSASTCQNTDDTPSAYNYEQESV